MCNNYVLCNNKKNDYVMTFCWGSPFPIFTAGAGGGGGGVLQSRECSQIFFESCDSGENYHIPIA